MIGSISRLHRKTHMFMSSHLMKLGLTGGQMAFIVNVCRHPGLNQNHLCELLDMDKSSVAKALMRMENDGFITRRHPDGDNRSIQIYPTDKALKILPQAMVLDHKWTNILMADMSAEEKNIFQRLLKKAAQNACSYDSSICAISEKH